MDVNELIEPDDWADLPEDPEEAFVRLIQTARPRFQHKLANCGGDEFAVHDIKHGYVTALLGIGTSFKIEPFATMEIPSPQNFNDQASREFDSQIAFFLAKAQANIAKRQRAGMVDVLARDRVTILLATQRLRKKVEESDLPAWKKKQLVQTLHDFERQLGAGRVNLTTITLTVVALMSAPGGVSQTYDWATEVFEPILRPLIEAKSKSDVIALANQTIITPRLAPPSSIAAIPARTRF